jgi:hypothetical protein
MREQRVSSSTVRKDSGFEEIERSCRLLLCCHRRLSTPDLNLAYHAATDTIRYDRQRRDQDSCALGWRLSAECRCRVSYPTPRFGISVTSHDDGLLGPAAPPRQRAGRCAQEAAGLLGISVRNTARQAKAGARTEHRRSDLRHAPAT